MFTNSWTIFNYSWSNEGFAYTDKKREEEEETLVNEFAKRAYKEAYITHSEKVWMSSWNRGSMTLVIDDLRELHCHTGQLILAL